MLPAIIGPKPAAEVLLRNLTIAAEQAVAWGLANRVVPADQIRGEALSVAQDIAAQQPGSVRHIKCLLRSDYRDLVARLEAERACFVEQIGTAEARKGISAFLEDGSK
jgi:enoyl-CoA hydratase/carnithine racemase